MTEKALYFFQCGDVVKVGQAMSPEKRLRQLQTLAPMPINILAVFPEMGHLEKDCHAYLRPYRVRGEWFQDNTTLRSLLHTLPIFPPKHVDSKRHPRKKAEFTYPLRGWVLDYRHLSLVEFATCLDITPRTAKRWLTHGGIPSRDKARICQVLLLRPEQVLWPGEDKAAV